MGTFFQQNFCIFFCKVGIYFEENFCICQTRWNPFARNFLYFIPQSCCILHIKFLYISTRWVSFQEIYCSGWYCSGWNQLKRSCKLSQTLLIDLNNHLSRRVEDRTHSSWVFWESAPLHPKHVLLERNQLMKLWSKAPFFHHPFSLSFTLLPRSPCLFFPFQPMLFKTMQPPVPALFMRLS